MSRVKLSLLILALLLCPLQARADSYRVVVSVDNGASWRVVPLPARVVQTILDELVKPQRTAVIQIKMTQKKKETLYAIQCHYESL